MSASCRINGRSTLLPPYVPLCPLFIYFFNIYGLQVNKSPEKNPELYFIRLMFLLLLLLCVVFLVKD